MNASQPGPARGSGRVVSPLDRFATVAGSGAVLLATAGFGRSPVRDAAYRFYEQRLDLDLKLSWRVFASLEDWGQRWPAEQTTFAAGLILSDADNPVVERAVGRCLFDLARIGRPLLWGIAGTRLGWYARFMMSPNGWPPERWLPHPQTYARLGVADDANEFHPRFDPILYSADADFFISDSTLCWWEARHFNGMVRRAEPPRG